MSSDLNIKLRLQEQLDDAAKTMAKLDPVKRVQWIAYFFEGLEAETEDEDYDFEGTVRGTIEMLNERLENGRW